MEKKPIYGSPRIQIQEALGFELIWIESHLLFFNPLKAIFS